MVMLFMDYPLKATAHFYQTELRYLLRNYPSVEIPIYYKAPSPRVSQKSLLNSLQGLFYYTWKRLTFHPVTL
jgi:dolichol-phosphate mannosyltransferase